MDIVWEGHIAGVFEGYLGGRFYELSDGSRWRKSAMESVVAQKGSSRRPSRRTGTEMTLTCRAASAES